jgi:Protein of unknown function (DUF2917)
MNSMLMSELHQSAKPGIPAARPWAWQLAAHDASTLQAAPEPRWLLVSTGSVWLTQVNAMSATALPIDIWLSAGQSLSLPAGTTWVLEAWQPAELSLAVHRAGRERRSFKRAWRGLFSWRQALWS